MGFLEGFTEEPLIYDKITTYIEKNIDEIQESVSQDENFLYFRSGENIKVFDRICDHAGGKLLLKGRTAICPLHGWELDVSKGSYINSGCLKKPILELNEYELDSPLVLIPKTTESLCGKKFLTENQTEIRFLNHACLRFTLGDISFASDPWLIGSAFSNGWWLSKGSPKDAFDQVNSCDFLYISHNHPDHLHPETLEYIRKDIPIVTAGFESGSTERLLSELGFNNITSMDFVSALCNEDKEIYLSVLKSGDFRDDSGLFIQHGKFSCLLTVDSNFLDFARFPKVDILCSSFAGGASGFPLCFENYTDHEKKVVLTRNRGAIKATNAVNIRTTKTKYFLPYASFFTEAAPRDLSIKKNNRKNSIEDFKEICSTHDAELINVNNEQVFKFFGSKLISKEIDPIKNSHLSNINNYLEYDPEKVNAELVKKVLDYFQGCEFQDNLFVELMPTDDSFTKYRYSFQLDFKSRKYKIKNVTGNDKKGEQEALASGLRYLRIKVREAELLNVINHGKPWEDLSIGFQCRIYRNPNIYNSNFWFYFTNVYIGKFAAQG